MNKKYVDLDEILLALPKNAAKIIEGWPAADVREVVYCESCEFYMQSNFVDKHMECVRFNHPSTPNDFCSHAVRVRKEQT